jgi:hypothetical protein
MYGTMNIKNLGLEDNGWGVVRAIVRGGVALMILKGTKEGEPETDS